MSSELHSKGILDKRRFGCHSNPSSRSVPGAAPKSQADPAQLPPLTRGLPVVTSREAPSGSADGLTAGKYVVSNNDTCDLEKTDLNFEMQNRKSCDLAVTSASVRRPRSRAPSRPRSPSIRHPLQPSGPRAHLRGPVHTYLPAPRTACTATLGGGREREKRYLRAQVPVSHTQQQREQPAGGLWAGPQAAAQQGASSHLHSHRFHTKRPLANTLCITLS